jgi:ABC-type transporter Mla maintaining outer membrane lipid asymmetry ATPase subunit MlaF
VTAAGARAAAAVELTSVTKQYGALRPLRVEQLTIAPQDRIALLGLDQPAAEVFVNLVTGASLPDTGTIRVFGRSTLDIADSSDWLSTLDRFGIISDRAPLIDSLVTGEHRELPVNLPNRGQAPYLPADVVVETMCIVDADGIHGRDEIVPPAVCAEWIRRHVEVQERTVEAALTGDRDVVCAAMALDPLCGRAYWN